MKASAVVLPCHPHRAGAIRFVLLVLLAAGAWAGSSFEDFLHATRLTQFSANVLRSEQHNFEHFAREIEHFHMP